MILDIPKKCIYYSCGYKDLSTGLGSGKLNHVDQTMKKLVLQKTFLPYFGSGKISVIDAFHSGKVRSDHPSQSRATACEIGGRPRGLDDAIRPMDLMIVVVVEGS